VAPALARQNGAFMKKILMIGTGGTIASKQTEDGLTPGLSSEDILSYIPQVKDHPLSGVILIVNFCHCNSIIFL
jgi:L-asparaginase